jgi:hypothetical protein
MGVVLAVCTLGLGPRIAPEAATNMSELLITHCCLWKNGLVVWKLVDRTKRFSLSCYPGLLTLQGKAGAAVV